MAIGPGIQRFALRTRNSLLHRSCGKVHNEKIGLRGKQVGIVPMGFNPFKSLAKDAIGAVNGKGVKHADPDTIHGSEIKRW